MPYLLLFLSFFAHAFTINPDSGQGFKSNQITIYISDDSCQGAGLSKSKFKSLVKKAVNDYWNAVPTSALKLSVKSSSKSIDGLDFSQAIKKVKDDSILAGCNDDVKEFDGSDRPGQVSSVLGAAVMDCDGSTCRAVFILNAHETSQVSELSDKDVVATIAHELGHAIGLGHSEYKHNLMYYSVSGKNQTWLGEDDIDGVSYLYPQEAKAGGLLGACASINTDPSEPPSSFLATMAFGIFLAWVFRYLANIKKLR